MHWSEKIARNLIERNPQEHFIKSCFAEEFPEYPLAFFHFLSYIKPEQTNNAFEVKKWQKL